MISKEIKLAYKYALKVEKELETRALSELEAAEFSRFLETTQNDKLIGLIERIKPGLTAEQFLCFIIPLERILNSKVTDSEILITTEDHAPSPTKNDLIIVLDNIRSPFNMGAVVRTCDALGTKKLIITGYSPDYENLKVQKTSMSAWKNVDLKKFRTLDEAYAYLKEKDYEVICVETTKASKNILKTPLKKNTALVFGNERFGISQKHLENADSIVELPVFGVKNSLNINAALTACGYEWVRQNG